MILETVESCYFIGKYLLVDKITLSFRLVPIYLINNRKEGEFENREKYLMIFKNSPPFQKSEFYISGPGVEGFKVFKLRPVVGSFKKW